MLVLLGVLSNVVQERAKARHARLRAIHSPPVGYAQKLLQPHHVSDDSIFFGDWYVIRGVAGAILWRLVNDYEELGRRHFTNRELRADPRLGLPAKNHNLEVRLAMLARRLEEVQAPIELDRSRRGIIRVAVWQPLLLRQVQPIAFRVFQPLVEGASPG